MTRPRRVLVTGAAGRLGRTVAAAFHDDGFEVLATDVVGVDDPPYAFRRADLLDHHVAADLVSGVDVVLHLGNHPGIGHLPPQVVFNENVSINENVFQGATEAGVDRIVFASTLQLIGSHPDERTVVEPAPLPTFPLNGESPPNPSNVYALSKVVSETMLAYYANRCGVDGTALRFPMLHRHDPWVYVDRGGERDVDVFEGFTGLTYDDAARLVRAVVDADLPGYHVLMAGTAHRHRDLSVAELIATFYPGTDPSLDDLVDNTAVTEATGWRPGSSYGNDTVNEGNRAT